MLILLSLLTKTFLLKNNTPFRPIKQIKLNIFNQKIFYETQIIWLQLRPFNTNAQFYFIGVSENVIAINNRRYDIQHTLRSNRESELHFAKIIKDDGK